MTVKNLNRTCMVLTVGIVCFFARAALAQDSTKMVHIETNSENVEIYIDNSYAGKGLHLDTTLGDGWHKIEGKRRNGVSDVEHVVIGNIKMHNVSLTVRKFRILLETRLCNFFCPDGAYFSGYPRVGIQIFKSHFIGADVFLFGASGHLDLNLTGFGVVYSYIIENEYFGFHVGATAGQYKYHFGQTFSSGSGYSTETYHTETNSNSGFFEPQIGVSAGLERMKLTGESGLIIGHETIPVLNLGFVLSF
jgi:hypothetical protein